MLRLPFLDIFLRLIPEGLIYCWACYVFSKTPFDKKRWLLTGVILGFSIYVIRLLPIHFGVHTILLIIILIFLSVTINRIKTTKVIPICLVVVSSMYLFEWLNLYILQNWFNIHISKIVEMENLILKNIYLYPSLLFLLITIAIGNVLINKFNERIKKHVSDGESF